MFTIRCEQCGKEFMAQRRSAKTCSALCRQHRRRGHTPVVLPPTFWDKFRDAFEEARHLALSTETIEEPVVSVGIFVFDDDNKLIRMWEFHEDA